MTDILIRNLKRVEAEQRARERRQIDPAVAIAAAEKARRETLEYIKEVNRRRAIQEAMDAANAP